jgi:hypothetical protein
MTDPQTRIGRDTCDAWSTLLPLLSHSFPSSTSSCGVPPTLGRLGCHPRLRVPSLSMSQYRRGIHRRLLTEPRETRHEGEPPYRWQSGSAFLRAAVLPSRTAAGAFDRRNPSLSGTAISVALLQRAQAPRWEQKQRNDLARNRLIDFPNEGGPGSAGRHEPQSLGVAAQRHFPSGYKAATPLPHSRATRCQRGIRCGSCGGGSMASVSTFPAASYTLASVVALIEINDY